MLDSINDKYVECISFIIPAQAGIQ